jgi:hypothetical protein
MIFTISALHRTRDGMFGARHCGSTFHDFPRGHWKTTRTANVINHLEEKPIFFQKTGFSSLARKFWRWDCWNDLILSRRAGYIKWFAVFIPRVSLVNRLSAVRLPTGVVDNLAQDKYNRRVG